MAKYCITALEKFVVRTTYHVEAASRKKAEALCREGKVGYERAEVMEGNEQWLDTISIEKT